MNASDKLPRNGHIQTIYDYLLGLIKKLGTKIIDVETLERQKKEAFVTPEMFGAAATV